MKSYAAFGLCIQSELPLPELQGCDRPTDVTVRLSHVEPVGMIEVTDYGWRAVGTDTIYLAFEGVGRFLMRAGREIEIAPEPDTEPNVLRHCLLSQALGVIAHQRGHLVLHASAVAVGGEAIGFLGGTGCGKSTTAATMCAGGSDLVTDDVLVIDTAGPVVYPAFPMLKLCPDTAGLINDRFTPAGEYDGKHVYRIRQSPLPLSLPLRRLYLLDRVSMNAEDSLSSQSLLIELIRHSYCLHLFTSAESQSHFRQCAELIKKVICRPLYSATSGSDPLEVRSLLSKVDAALSPHPVACR